MLTGWRLLDLSSRLPGPLCSLVLSDLGMEVIRVEPPEGLGKGDIFREFPEEKTPYFPMLNRGKKSVTLNLKSEKGRHLFLEMAKRADVVLEGFRPGVMDRLEIGWPRLRQVKFSKEYVSFVYGEHIEMDDRLQLYRQGVDRVLEWSDKCATNLFTLAKIRFYRDRELLPYLQKFITRGKLNEFHLADILAKSILEKKNLIFKLLDGDWTAKMRVFRGEVVEAWAPTAR